MAGTAVAIIAATITVVARPNSNFFLNFPLPFLLRSTEDRLQRFELYPNIGFSEPVSDLGNEDDAGCQRCSPNRLPYSVASASETKRS